MSAYQQFLESKRFVHKAAGFESDAVPIGTWPFQRTIIRWALRKGKAAIFADCGLGKTLMQLAWAHAVADHTKGNVLIFAPLAVAAQTVKEGASWGIHVTQVDRPHQIQPGINITNYQKLEHFSGEEWAGLVLDESSILKGQEGATRLALNRMAHTIPYRLCCTATPAPNDLTEIINHAEFLGIMSEKEIKALFFTQDGNTQDWRLKGYASRDFWKWLASWAVAIRKPSDIGFDDTGMILPAIEFHEHRVDSEYRSTDLFGGEVKTLTEQRAARKASLLPRVDDVAARVNSTPGPWVVWCNQNDESVALTKAIPDAVEVTGSMDDAEKEERLNGFTSGKYRVIVTKPSIAGFGLNWQHCHQTDFVGLSHSYEQYYQAIRRLHRFGQKNTVQVHITISDAEGDVLANIRRKERESRIMMEELVSCVAMECDINKRTITEEMDYNESIVDGDGYTAHLGDSVNVIKKIPTESVHMSVFSPPFPGMYVYSNSPNDMGNCKTIDELMQQFSFLAPELNRITIPGRMCVIHLTQMPMFKGKDGFCGVRDFRGKTIKLMEDSDWIYYGEACIEKNPQVTAIRTKDAGLLFKSLANDSSRMHMALPDYLIYFRKKGDNPIPIRAGQSLKYGNPEGWITQEEWIKWASPVWLFYKDEDGRRDGIDMGDTLNERQARETDDERHLCPLQLGVIERAVKLWSAPGETVFSPFMGIGSEGYKSILLGRKFIGIELKRSYFDTAVSNLNAARRERAIVQVPLFAEVAP